MYLVHLNGNLRLLDVAEIVKSTGFKSTVPSILDENFVRKHSDRETAQNEYKFYEELHEYMLQNFPEAIKSHDGYFTHATRTFHVEMVLFSKEIIYAVNTASRHFSSNGSPSNKMTFSCRNGYINGTVEGLPTMHNRERETSRRKRSRRRGGSKGTRLRF